MTALPQDSYLDFAYAPKYGYMTSLWRDDRQPSKEATVDLDGFCTPGFMAALLSAHYVYSLSSFENYIITILDGRLKALAGEAARSMTEEAFSIYAPTLSDFITDSTPMVKHDDHGQIVEPEEMLLELSRAIAAYKLDEPKNVAVSLMAFYQTLTQLLSAVVKGRRYRVVTGLPRLDAWIVEAQTCLEEFVLPNGVGDELRHRDLIRMQIFMHFANGDTVRGGEYITATQKMPNDAILAFNGEELIVASSRREAVDLYLAVELDVAKRELANHERDMEPSRKRKKVSILDRINRWIGLD